MDIIRKIIKEVLRDTKNKITIKEIDYFSVNGINKLPNGHPLQKSGYIKECSDNSKKFKTNNFEYLISNKLTLVEAIHDSQYGLTDYRGGVITFSTEVNSLDINKNKLINWFSKKGISLLNKYFSKSKLTNIINKFNDSEKVLGKDKIEDYIGAFSIGNFFSGRYIGDNKKVFDENSLSIEINGISSKGLIYLAELIAREFKQETVLVKDLNSNKIFLVNQEIGDNYNIDDLNKKAL